MRDKELVVVDPHCDVKVTDLSNNGVRLSVTDNLFTPSMASSPRYTHNGIMAKKLIRPQPLEASQDTVTNLQNSRKSEAKRRNSFNEMMKWFKLHKIRSR